MDRTAGRLARWLRILGLDTEYVDTCDVSVVARQARQSGRTLITRNHLLAERLGGAGILLGSQQLGDQLRQVVDEVGRDKCTPFSRCSACNARLVPAAREGVRGRVPAYVYQHHDRFSVCPVCGRYYWRGTHWHIMHREIEQIMGGMRDGDE